MEKDLIEIVSYKYKASGAPYVFLDYCYSKRVWQLTWRNPIEFKNEKQTDGSTPSEACKKALEFIKSNPTIFTKRLKP